MAVIMSTSQNATGCSHLQNYRSKNKDFKMIEAFVKVFVKPNSHEYRKIKSSNVFCFTCGSHIFVIKVFACLECAFIGCNEQGHRHKHAEEKDHQLAFDLVCGYVFCNICNDYVHCKEIDEICVLYARESTCWWPSEVLKNELLENRSLEVRRCVSGNYTFGLRGLINLGNTCFMNCIVQALCHTPILVDYFLSDRHVCRKTVNSSDCIVCNMSRTFRKMYSGERSAHAANRLLYLIWQHSKQLAGYEQQDAHEFLITILDLLHKDSRESDKYLAEKRSIDELEHARVSSQCMSPTTTSSGYFSGGAHYPQCQCIVDQIFYGALQSDLTCQACFHISTRVDPLCDISLDLAGLEGNDKKRSEKATLTAYSNHSDHVTSSTPLLLINSSAARLSSSPQKIAESPTKSSAIFLSANSKSPLLMGNNPKIIHYENGIVYPQKTTLLECLWRYTQPEHIGGHKCCECHAQTFRTKQLSLHRLPIVLSFHLKRFEHSMQLHKKISLPVSFPLELDMSPYMWYNIVSTGHPSRRTRHFNPEHSPRQTADYNRNNINNIYALFAVVVHKGTIQSGHYTAYIRPRGGCEWFCCDDHTITVAHESEVLNSEGYLLFYCKKRFY